MANNVFQVKRTNVSGRTPNTTGSYGTNSQYIAAGEFALNMADGILYTSNGSAEITVGANLINQNITGNLTVKAIIANGSIGTANQVLTSNGSAVYWSTAGGGSGTVTSVATGNGMTGGPITTTGTVSILANTGIVANSTGTFVNATYIETLSANSATYLGAVGNFGNSSGIYTSGVSNAATLSTGTTFIANATQVTVAVPFSANGGTGTAGHVLTSNGATGSPYWAAAAGGGYYKGGSAAVGTLAVGGQNLFRVNANTLNNNTTIATGENAQATGPITVASGITLTVESGARVAII